MTIIIARVCRKDGTLQSNASNLKKNSITIFLHFLVTIEKVSIDQLIALNLWDKIQCVTATKKLTNKKLQADLFTFFSRIQKTYKKLSQPDEGKMFFFQWW